MSDRQKRWQIGQQLDEASRVFADYDEYGYAIARLNALSRAITAIAGRQDTEQRINDRQDQALTEIEAAVAEVGRLFDRITQLERRVEEIGRAFAACNVRLLQ
jgi:hypothetical protein